MKTCGFRGCCAAGPWKKSSGHFSTDENLRFSRVLRTRHVIPDVQQAVYAQPARVVSRKFVSIHNTTFPAFQAGNQAI
jgi:hypothetical protein